MNRGCSSQKYLKIISLGKVVCSSQNSTCLKNFGNQQQCFDVTMFSQHLMNWWILMNCKKWKRWIDELMNYWWTVRSGKRWIDELMNCKKWKRWIDELMNYWWTVRSGKRWIDELMNYWWTVRRYGKWVLWIDELMNCELVNYKVVRFTSQVFFVNWKKSCEL